MSRWQLVALLLGLLLVAAPFAKHNGVYADDEYEDEDGGDAPAEGDADPSEKDVVVITKDNFDTAVKKAKFALVRPPARQPPARCLAPDRR